MSTVAAYLHFRVCSFQPKVFFVGIDFIKFSGRGLIQEPFILNWRIIFSDKNYHARINRDKVVRSSLVISRSSTTFVLQ